MLRSVQIKARKLMVTSDIIKYKKLYLECISEFASVCTVVATAPPWLVYSGTLWPKYKTETHFVVLMSLSVSRIGEYASLCKIPGRRAKIPRETLHSKSRTMISAQTIGVSSSRIPLPAGISRLNSAVSLSPKREALIKWSSGLRTGGGGSRTLVTERASFFTTGAAADASDDGVSAKQTAVVHDFTDGNKNVELMDPISPAKHASTIDDQLPPLHSMVVDGLPPLQLSKYVHEAEKHLHQYVEWYPNVNSLDSYCRLGLSSATYWHPGVVSFDPFLALATIYALLLLLDDILFDTPDGFHQDQYGIGRETCRSPQKIQEYLHHLHEIFSQQVRPQNSAPLIETLMSNPVWFRSFIASVKECHHASILSHADIVQGHNFCFQDLKSYTMMRAGNGGDAIVQLMVEFANNAYVPSALTETSKFKSLTTATSIHIGFVNDVFSYHKESLIEQNRRNLITILMECEARPFVQIVYRGIGLVNTYAYAIMNLKVEVWNSSLRNHLENIKVLLAQNIYFNLAQKYY